MAAARPAEPASEPNGKYTSAVSANDDGTAKIATDGLINETVIHGKFVIYFIPPEDRSGRCRLGLIRLPSSARTIHCSNRGN
jgi:hypothetical protein